MSEDLKMAIVAVRRHGLDPFDRIAVAMPTRLTGRAYARWIERQARATEQVAERLSTAGASIDLSDRATRIAFAGIEALSTLGLYQALKNWNGKARKRMREYNRGDRR